MNRIHIIGGKNHGKTKLVTELVQELSARGICVGTIKHTHHHHELDVPGKDSHRHRESGAKAVGILSRSMNAVYWSPGDLSTKPLQDSRYDSFAPMFAHCSVVVVEGDSRTTSPKLEVWRALCETTPLAKDDLSIDAVITDDQVELSLAQVSVPVLARKDIVAIADAVLTLSGK